MTRFFGTDGIRGRAGEGKLSDASVIKMARAIGAHFGAGTTAALGRDTRLSGPHIQALIETELLRFGVNVIRLGVIPTPATALLAGQLGADFAIMITASHNPYHDNGVKLFGADGRKLSAEAQDAIEALIMSAPEPSGDAGTARDHDSSLTDYAAALMKSVGLVDLSMLKIVADCANGAAYEVLPHVLHKLGASPILIGVSPDGENINANCGSTHTAALAQIVKLEGADIGVALDGDADRIILIDRLGQEIDGDKIIARLAIEANAADRLKSGSVVATVMSNLGFERFLVREGIGLERTAVGDRFVAAKMHEIGANFGGEPSGHILMTDFATTGDGCLAALHLLAGLQRSGQGSEDYLHVFEPYPQVLKNVRFSGRSPLLDDAVSVAITAADERLGEEGRVLVRASGTEPKIRVMAEGTDLALVTQVVDELCEIIAAHAK